MDLDFFQDCATVLALPTLHSSPFCHSMKLQCVILATLLFLLPAGRGGKPESSAIDLRTFIGCAVREFTFLAKKPGCKALRITTDACWGRCETWEVRLWAFTPSQEKPSKERH